MPHQNSNGRQGNEPQNPAGKDLQNPTGKDLQNPAGKDLQNPADAKRRNPADARQRNPATRPPRHRRIVVKAGTALLTGGSESIDIEVMASLVGQIARLRAAGCEMLLVTSGAVAAGRRVLGVSPGEKNVPLRQALAAVGQSHLMHAYEQLFSWREVPIAQALISRRDIADRLGYINIRNALSELAARRVIPIINENDVVAVEELSGDAFGDNDTLSALVANLVDAVGAA